MLFGLKTVAFFDLWSIEHFFAGVSLGGFCLASKKLESSQSKILFFLLMCFIWEALEHYLETGLLGSGVEYWFQGVEFWGNRLITDPLLMILGYVLAVKNKRSILYARIFSFIWIFLHVFIFPHSMWLQENYT